MTVAEALVQRASRMALIPPMDLLSPVPAQEVREEERGEVADVGEAVDGGPAVVHPHAARLEGLEELLRLREGVINLKRHALNLSLRLRHQEHHHLGLDGFAADRKSTRLNSSH